MAKQISDLGISLKKANEEFNKLVNTRIAPTQLKVEAIDDDVGVMREKFDAIRTDIEKNKGLSDNVDEHT